MTVEIINGTLSVFEILSVLGMDPLYEISVLSDGRDIITNNSGTITGQISLR